MNLTAPACAAYNRRTTHKAAAASVNPAVFLRPSRAGARHVYGGMIAVNTIPQGNSGSLLCEVVESRPPHPVGNTLTKHKGISHELRFFRPVCAALLHFLPLRPTAGRYCRLLGCYLSAFCCTQSHLGCQRALFLTRSHQPALSNCARRFGAPKLIRFRQFCRLAALLGMPAAGGCLSVAGGSV